MLSQVVVKLNRACNLRCKYCYYINDKTVNKGHQLELNTLFKFLDKYVNYCRSRGIKGRVSFHGGEPLLYGKSKFQKIFKHDAFLSREIKPSIQTNGVLIDNEWISIFKRNEVTIGLSLDGPQDVNDKYRVLSNGDGSYKKVIEGLLKLQKADVKHGVLSVLDPSASGKEVFEHIVSLGVKDLDFLPPISNHFFQTTNPVDLEGTKRFLVEAFMAWVNHGDPTVSVRIFRELFWNYLGIGGGYSAIGMDQWGTFVVLETDGRFARNEEFIDIDFIDPVKRYYIGKNVDDSIEEVEEAAKLKYANLDHLGLPTECKSCSMNNVCKGGNISSRYDQKRSFNNPSVHCRSLFAISHLIKLFSKSSKIKSLRETA